MSQGVLPVLSVIIPVYNRPDFLQECLESLHECGYSDLEIIVVDDGSTVDIVETVQNFRAACKYLRQDNQGPSAARNLGFAHAQGRYLAFVDSDDQWLPGLIQKVVDLLERYSEVDMIFSEAHMGNPEEGYQSGIEVTGGEQFFQLPCRRTTEGLMIFDKTALFCQMLKKNPVLISAVVLRREAFERAGKFDPALRMAEDWELWLRIASQMQLAFYPESVANYTRHSGCVSYDQDKMGEGFYTALKKIRQRCTYLGSQEREILERQLRLHLFGQAYHAYDRGEYMLARERFARLNREAGISVKGILYSSLCLLPPQVIRVLRRFKWAFGN